MHDIVLSVLCVLLWVLSFVCKYPCSHETETNGEDMAVSLACVDKSDAPSWRLCRPFISYTLLR